MGEGRIDMNKFRANEQLRKYLMRREMGWRRIFSGVFFILVIAGQRARAAELTPINFVSSVDFRKFVEPRFIEEVLREMK
jgi:hypothetical protein